MSIFLDIVAYNVWRRKIAFHVKGTKTWTPTQKTDLLEQRTRLHRLVARFRAIQIIYMLPATASSSDPTPNGTSARPAPGPASKRKRGELPLGDDDGDKPIPIEQQKLLLPSELPSDVREACHPGLDEIERRMRDAQCRTSLDRIRTHLYMKSGLTTYKQRHARHQQANTRSRETIDNNDVKIKIFQDKYNTARTALIALGANESELEWKPIKDADLRCLEDEEMDEKREARRLKLMKKMSKTGKNALENGAGPGQNSRVLSWIWEGAGRDPDVSTGLNEGAYPTPDLIHWQPVTLISIIALRVQWAKARARSRRWHEEVNLLKEEMRRVLVFLEHKAAWWVERGRAECREVSPELAEGLLAYAEGQAQLRRDLASSFEAKWAILRRDNITDTELDELAPKARQEQDAESDGAETGSEEEGANSDDDDEAQMDDEDIPEDE